MGSRAGLAGLETSDLLSLWDQEISMRREAATVQMAVLDDNVDRRRHELASLDRALERARKINKHLREMGRLENELRMLEYKLREMELEKLRLDTLREAKVSDRNELVDLFNKLRSNPAPDKPWFVRAKDSLVAEIPLFLDLIAVAILARLVCIILKI